ncbi:MAG TPA: hypothetical protein VNQ56_04690 [Pseudolabrys sp.]|nr:hypothetical protein [Pseudolabrys sp.]
MLIERAPGQRLGGAQPLAFGLRLSERNASGLRVVVVLLAFGAFAGGAEIDDV